MKIKLGPYKISPELWRDIQELPGANDEQRVLQALHVAVAYVKEAKARRAELAQEIADTAAAVRASLEQAHAVLKTIPGERVTAVDHEKRTITFGEPQP